MFNITKLVNRITDRGQGSGREGVAEESSPSFIESEEQHSAEGFICPSCMRAFPSAESLKEHYDAAHFINEGNQSPSDSQSSTNGDIQTLRQEIQNLQSCLNEEKTTSAELKSEVLKIQAGFQSKDEDSVSIRSQEKELENVKSMLSSEVALLRQQLTDSLEQLYKIKKEKEILDLKVLDLATENGAMQSDVSSLNSKLAHKNSIDDAAVLKQELVSVQRVMNELSLEKENKIEELNDIIVDLNKCLLEQKTDEVGKDKLIETQNQMLLLQKQLEDDKVALALLQSNFESQQEQKSRELDTLMDKVSDSERNRELSEKECSDLKDLVKRLQEQHAELFSKIEGGEGEKAALEALQRQNVILKESIETAQENLNEVSTNLYNANKKCEKGEAELKKLMETLKTETEKFRLKEIEFKNNIEQKDGELVTALRKYDVLAVTSEEKDSEIKSLQSLIGINKEEVNKLKEELRTQVTIKEKLQSKLDSSELEVKNQRQAAIQANNNLQEIQKALQKFDVELDKRKIELTKLSTTLEDVHCIKNILEEKLLISEKEHIEVQKSYVDKVKTLEGKMEILKSKCEELEEAKKSTNNAMVKLKAELEQSLQDGLEKKHQLEGLQETIQVGRSRDQEKEDKIQLLQTQTDEILTDKIDLERRVKSNEEEKSLLLERCLSGESEVEELRQTIKTIQRKLDDSHAALQELGRENQSLQMESAKLQGRKWADDSLVTNCSTCEKEFTLTIRKHHCRHCGQIFCNDCSSRHAAVPSCKKPARVCDACYQELMSK